MSNDSSLTKDRAKTPDTVTIKKYANRRLYNTASSSYVTLEDLSAMVKEGTDFVVFDAKSGDDITRSVLTQIIFEQENRGQNLLPIQFLRQLIRFYGDSVQAVVPSYLEMSLEAFTRQREHFKEAWSSNMALEAFQDQTRKNIELFEQAVRMFQPFRAGREGAGMAAAPSSEDDVTALRRELAAMQKRIDALSAKSRD